MTDGTQGPVGEGAASQEGPSPDELRAKLEEELRRIDVRDVLLQTVVTLVNLSGQRLGLTEGSHETKDLEQGRLAIDAVRALLPLIEQSAADQAGPIRDALAQLQMAYAREAGSGGESDSAGQAGPATAEHGQGEAAGAAQGSGSTAADRQSPRTSTSKSGLWVPPGSTD